MLADLEVEIAKVKAEAKKRYAREQKAEKQIKAVTDAAEKGNNVSGALGETRSGRNTRGSSRKVEDEEDDFDPMEVDGGSGGMAGGGKKRTGGGGGASGFMGKLTGRSGR